MLLERELNIAILAAKNAGDKIMEIYSKDFSVDLKNDASPVTEADVQANICILETLKKDFPMDGYLSEETSDDQSRFAAARCWVIDPLDGTKEFIKKNGEFAVSIGLVDQEGVCLGVVYSPVRACYYYAVRGSGAYKQIEGEQPVKINVSNRHQPYHLLISRSHPSKKTLKLMEVNSADIMSITEMGSALKGCLIAEGLYDVYYNFGYSMKWDTCAMDCIVHEAGGTMRKLDGTPIDYHEIETRNVGFYIVNDSENLVDLTRF